MDCGTLIEGGISAKIVYGAMSMDGPSVGEVSTYFGPPCPSLDFRAKSICIRVTSGGSIAAPFPSLIDRSYDMGQLKVLSRLDIAKIVYLL